MALSLRLDRQRSGAARHHGIDGYAESGTDREPNRDAGSVSDKNADRCAKSGTDGDECFTLKPPLGRLFVSHHSSFHKSGYRVASVRVW